MERLNHRTPSFDFNGSSSASIIVCGFSVSLPCHDTIYVDQPPAVVQTSKLPPSKLLRLSRRWRLCLVHRQRQQVS